MSPVAWRYGIILDYPVARAYADAVQKIYRGYAIEIMKLNFGRSMVIKQTQEGLDLVFKLICIDASY